MIFDLIQLVGGLMLSYSYVPQIIKIYKLKSARDVSLGMYVLCALGTALFEIYALYLFLNYSLGITLLFTNTLSVLLSTTTIFLIKRYQK